MHTCRFGKCETPENVFIYQTVEFKNTNIASQLLHLCANKHQIIQPSINLPDSCHLFLIRKLVTVISSKSMLIHSGLLAEFLKCLKPQVWTTGLRWYDWNQETNYVRLNAKAYLITFILCAIFTICRLYNMLLDGNNKDSDPSGILTYTRTMFMLVPLTVGHYAFEMVRYNNTVEKLFMGLASFEKRYCPKGQGNVS